MLGGVYSSLRLEEGNKTRFWVAGYTEWLSVSTGMWGEAYFSWASETITNTI